MLSRQPGEEVKETALKVPANKPLLRALAGHCQGLRGTAYIMDLSGKWKQALEAKPEQGDYKTIKV